MALNDERTSHSNPATGPARHHTAALRPLPAKTKHKPSPKLRRKAAFVHWLNRYGLSRRKLRRNKIFGRFGSHIFSKDLWSFKPDSLAKGWLIGCLSASTPFMGAQIIMALPFNILFRANIPVTIGLILLTNPATAVPYYGFAFWLGCMIMGSPLKGEGEAMKLTSMDLTTLLATMKDHGVFTFLAEILSGVFLNLMVGCVTIGVTLGLLGFFGIRFFVKHPPTKIIQK